MISAYSFTEVAHAARKMMPDGGALLTLSFLGAQRSTPNYNVMGVAKAALEASVRYLAVDLGVNRSVLTRFLPDRCAPLPAWLSPGPATFSAMLKKTLHYGATPALTKLDRTGRPLSII